MNNLQKDSTSNNMTVVPQIPAPVAQNTDSKTLEGSHAGDHRGEAAAVNPLAGNDRPVRGETGQAGA